MKTILVVDDSPVIVELIKGLLEPEGFLVLVAEDGEQALQLFRSNHVDLSIIDIFLPRKGGLQVMSEIASTNRNNKFIAISGGEAFNPQSVLDLAASFDASETFAKPIDAAKLLAKVKELTNG